MFFIFDIGPKTVRRDKGLFSCPACHTYSSYEIKQKRVYFCLFLIPIIPLSKLQTSKVTCLNCRAHLPEEMILKNQQQTAF